MDTIFAPATAQGRAGVSIVRLSGPDAPAIASSLCGSLPPAREVALRALRGPAGEIVDRALVTWFKAPASFTGEDVVEFHLHGSVAVLRSVLALLARDPRARMAEPGEFTRRALENDRLDLSQVEGLADLIDAETETQRKQAMRVLSGAVGAQVDRWRSGLVRAAALLEATIDFADEDVPVDVTPEVTALLASVTADLEREIAGSFAAERIRGGFEVALIGPPNAGKSTLLNRLAGRDAAITSEIAGTTRDVIEVRLDVGGLPVTFLDTAGLRESEDRIEAIGVQRSIVRAEDADLRVFLAAPGELLLIEPREDDLRLTPKVDLSPPGTRGVSGATGQGVTELLSEVERILSKRVARAGVATHARHRIAMERALEALANTRCILERGPDEYDIAAEELRIAIRALEALVGRVDVETLLDEIFSSFCLGK